MIKNATIDTFYFLIFVSFKSLVEKRLSYKPTLHDTIALSSVDFMFTWQLSRFTKGYNDSAAIYNKDRFDNE